MDFSAQRPQWKTAAKQIVKEGKTSPLVFTAAFIGILLLFSLLTTIFSSSVFLGILQALITPVLTVGFLLFCLGIRRNQEMPMVTLFDGFRNVGKTLWLAINLFVRVLVYFLVGSLIGSVFVSIFGTKLYGETFTATLDALMSQMQGLAAHPETINNEALAALLPLFIISAITCLFGGIVCLFAVYKYRFAYYNFCRYTELPVREVLYISALQSKGHRLQLLLLDLTFLGWFLLGFLSAGVLFIWVLPYYTETNLFYYEACEQARKDTLTEAQ